MTTPNAIAIQLAGGLGNQLFQYAAARATSLRLGCPLLLDLSFLDNREGVHTLRPYTLGSFRIGAQIEAPEGRNDAWSEYHQPSYTYDPGFESISAETRLFGYFQSERFFRDHADTIRSDLSLAAPASPEFGRAAQAIAGARLPVSIHLRRGDFASDPRNMAFHGICGEPYYRKARRIVEGLVGTRPDYFVFTDDPNAAEAMFRDIPSCTIVRTLPSRPWEDLVLMSRCRHHILANSSFSWWGSWLNPNSDKVVVAPRLWVSQEALRTLNTADLHPDSTILV